MEKTVHVYFPRWATRLYAIMAIILAPWIFNLAESLPARHLERHWDAVWVGFDLIMLTTILLTLWFMIKRKIWVVVSASALATLLVTDAWFDILTAKNGSELHEAIGFGVIELSLGLLTYRLIYLVIHHATPQKNFNLHIEKNTA